MYAPAESRPPSIATSSAGIRPLRRGIVTAVLLALLSALMVPVAAVAEAPEFHMFDNGRIRFGGGGPGSETVPSPEASVNGVGNLQQPYYWSQSAGRWYQLTFSNHPLDFAIGTGTTGSNWSGATVVENPALSNQTIDTSGFVTTSTSANGGAIGHGTLVSTGDWTINDQSLRISNTYTLGASDSFVRITTRITNTSGSMATNVNLWTGTRDDYVGASDRPTKTKGVLESQGFVPTTAPSDLANALQITSGAEGVLFYSSTPGTNTAINTWGNWSNAYNQYPSTSQLQVTHDGSYAMHLPVGELASGASADLVWFYAAGELADLDDVARDVAAAASPPPPPRPSVGPGEVTLDWDEPESADPLTDYAIRYSDDGGQSWTTVRRGSVEHPLQMTIDDLIDGMAYTFQVAGVTGSGDGEVVGRFSESSTLAIPGGPVNDGIPSISTGDAEAPTFGRPVTGSSGEWTNHGEQELLTAYQWFRVLGDDEDAIDEATDPTYVPVSADVGAHLILRVTVSNEHDSIPVRSEPSDVVRARAPGAPTAVEVEVGDASLAVSWSAPEDDGGAAIDGYSVSATLSNGDVEVAGCTPNPPTDTSCVVTGLSNGSVYAVTVVASNADASGLASDPVTGTPARIPGTPTGVSTAGSDGRVLVSWSAPEEDGGTPIIGYAVTAVDADGADAGSCTRGAADATSCVVTGLTNGDSYLFTVAAENVRGTGPSTAAVTGVPATVPGAPSGLNLERGDGEVTVDWLPPTDDGGAVVTGYRVTVDESDGSNGVASCEPGTTDATTCTVTGLTNGTAYRFRVQAVNAQGPGAVSSARTATPATLPGAPTIVYATTGTTAAWVHVRAPQAGGGSPVVAYEISRDEGGTWTLLESPGIDRPIVLSGLPPDIEVAVQVRAVNAVGAGPASWTLRVTPGSRPFGDDGSPLPEVAPGTSKVLIGGLEYTAAMSRDGSVVTISHEGFRFEVEALDARGVALRLDVRGHVAVERGGALAITGTGFWPGSEVEVWLASTPTFLGALAVALDGTVSGQFPVPDDLEPGDHTLQVRGIDADGMERIVALGVVLAETEAGTAPDTEPDTEADTEAGGAEIDLDQRPREMSSLAVTGADSGRLLFFGLLLLGAGVGLRRQSTRFGSVC